MQSIYGRGGVMDITHEYASHLSALAQHFDVSVSTLWIEVHPTIGDECIYSNDRWLGYVGTHLDVILGKLEDAEPQ